MPWEVEGVEVVVGGGCEGGRFERVLKDSISVKAYSFVILVYGVLSSFILFELTNDNGCINLHTRVRFSNG